MVIYSLCSYFLLRDYIQNGEQQDMDLLESTSQIFYGVKTSDNTDKKVSIKLDELGESAILFNTGDFASDDFSIVELSISDIPINYRPFLVWQTKDDATINEIELSQPNGSIKSNLLNHPNWKDDIVQIGIRIAPQNHLGLFIPLENSITINSISLRKANLGSDFSLLFNFWREYKPLSYVAINHLEANQQIPLFAQPFIFMLLWMSVSIVLILLTMKRQMILLIALVAWLFFDLLQLNNMRKVSQWTNEVYSEKSKIHVDQQLYDIAMRVRSILGLDLDNVNKLKNTKVLVLSSDKYQRARVIYHMLPVNSSFLDINLEKNTESNVSAGDFIMSMSLTRNPKRPVNGQLQFNDHNINVKEIWNDSIVSIMEVQE